MIDPQLPLRVFNFRLVLYYDLPLLNTPCINTNMTFYFDRPIASTHNGGGASPPLERLRVCFQFTMFNRNHL